ncbi:MAG TPA: carboxymuconolactone decarboxylase family protein, partial [Miltoncostaeaceae bacterium]|nr:carboxymuconolactone decarboxylase family protein [Miltoncostaeaceae bacterium]
KGSQMRIDYQAAAPDCFTGMLGLEMSLHHGELEPELIELVKMRASQINGCAHCLDMHSKDARARGETEQRLYLLNAWREAPFYTERERAALAWCEALTDLPSNDVEDEVFAPVRELFSDEEIAVLTYAIVAINGWNRLAIGLRSPVGDYVSPHARATQAG